MRKTGARSGRAKRCRPKRSYSFRLTGPLARTSGRSTRVSPEDEKGARPRAPCFAICASEQSSRPLCFFVGSLEFSAAVHGHHPHNGTVFPFAGRSSHGLQSSPDGYRTQAPRLTSILQRDHYDSAACFRSVAHGALGREAGERSDAGEPIGEHTPGHTPPKGVCGRAPETIVVISPPLSEPRTPPPGSRV